MSLQLEWMERTRGWSQNDGALGCSGIIDSSCWIFALCDQEVVQAKMFVHVLGIAFHRLSHP